MVEDLPLGYFELACSDLEAAEDLLQKRRPKLARIMLWPLQQVAEKAMKASLTVVLAGPLRLYVELGEGRVPDALRRVHSYLKCMSGLAAGLRGRKGTRARAFSGA